MQFRGGNRGVPLQQESEARGTIEMTEEDIPTQLH